MYHQVLTEIGKHQKNELKSRKKNTLIFYAFQSGPRNINNNKEQRFKTLFLIFCNEHHQGPEAGKEINERLEKNS